MWHSCDHLPQVGLLSQQLEGTMEHVRRQRRLSASDQRRLEHGLSTSDPPGCSCKQRQINGARGVVQVVDRLSGMEKALGSSPAMHKPGVVVHTCNPRRIQSTMPSLGTHFEASLGTDVAVYVCSSRARDRQYRTASLVCLVRFRPVRNPFSKRISDFVSQ